MQIESLASADSWLSITAAEVDANGLGSYFVDVDRSQLVTGSHSSSIVINSNAGSSSIQVILLQRDPGSADSGDAGLLYILLVNAQSGEVEQETSVYVNGGEYTYSFSEVPPGDYQIYAGGDADNDFFICDAGEACGAWPVLDSQAAIIQLRQDLSNMDFSITFSTGINSASEQGSSAPGWRRRGRLQQQ